jgi:hypothetical protein
MDWLDGDGLRRGLAFFRRVENQCFGDLTQDGVARKRLLQEDSVI